MVFPQHMVGASALFGAGGAACPPGADILRRAAHIHPRVLGAGDKQPCGGTRLAPAGTVVHRQLFSETDMGQPRAAAPVGGALRRGGVRDFRLLRIGIDVPKQRPRGG